MIESLEPMFIPEKEFEVTDSLIDELEAETADFIFQKIDGRKRRGLSPLLVGSVASIALLTVIVWVLYSPYRGGVRSPRNSMSPPMPLKRSSCLTAPRWF